MISYDMTNEAYHSSAGISKSGLDLLARSPKHYWASLQQKQEQSTAFLIGSATHTAILEPKELSNRYAVIDADMRTKEGKEQKAEALKQGKDVLTGSQYADILRMRDSVMSHSIAKELFTNGDPEVSCLTEIDGASVRARADWLRKDKIIVDLKTTADASEREFSKSVASFNYHRQAAWYMDLFNKEWVDVDMFLFVCVEKTAPFSVAVYELDGEAIDQGRDECHKLLSIYKECMANEDWPSYPENITKLQLPAWKRTDQW